MRRVGDKANACRELKLAGTEKSIPVLASLLADAELSHPARFALESMPYPAAGAALRDALGKATGLARAGIIDSLGQRRDPLAVPLIAPDLAAKDLVLVAAAATALGKIGTSEAASLLWAARADAEGPARIKIDDGLLLCADRLHACRQRRRGCQDLRLSCRNRASRGWSAPGPSAAGCKRQAPAPQQSSPHRWPTTTPWSARPPPPSCTRSPTRTSAPSRAAWRS